MPFVVSSGEVVNASLLCPTPVYATSDNISENLFSYRLYCSYVPLKP
ncbi:hypothetical protein [Hominilimicola sp.]